MVQFILDYSNQILDPSIAFKSVKSLFLELQILPSCDFTRADVSGRTTSCFCCEELLELSISVGIHNWLFGKSASNMKYQRCSNTFTISISMVQNKKFKPNSNIGSILVHYKYH